MVINRTISKLMIQACYHPIHSETNQFYTAVHVLYDAEQ